MDRDEGTYVMPLNTQVLQNRTDPGPGNFVLYSSKDGINWDEGILLMSLDKSPGGGDCYSGNTIIGKYNLSTPNRLLIQADISYKGAVVNIHHWFVDVPTEYP